MEEVLSVAKGDRFCCPALGGGEPRRIPASPLLPEADTVTHTHTVSLPATHGAGLDPVLEHVSLGSATSCLRSPV